MKKINQDIKNKTFEKIYMVTGNEEYIMRDIKNKFISAFDDDMSTFIFNKDKFDDIEVKNTILTHSFFSTKKLIIFDKVNLSENKNVNRFIEYMNENIDNNVILILESNEIKTKTLLNYVKQVGYYTEVKTESDEVLEKYIIKKVKDSKKQIRESTVIYILEKCGSDLFNLSNEMNKLINFVGEKEEIEKKDVDEILIDTLENRIYNMIDFMNKNDKKNVLRLYADLVALNVKTGNIIGLIKNNYVQLAKVRELIDEGDTVESMMKKLNIRQKWQIEKIVKVARGIKTDDIVEKIDTINDINKRRITGNIDEKVAMSIIIS